MAVADVNGININYRFEGTEKGPVVMLSNSLASDLSMWDKQVPVLVEAGYGVLRSDSRGHGKSRAPEGPYSIGLLADDAVGLMDVLGLEKVHFCGLSKGGMVGQMMGKHHGDRLISLVLSSTSAHMPPPELWNERIEAVQRHGMKAVADATIDRWFTKPGQKRLPEDVEKVRRFILNTPATGFCACCEAIRDMDQRDSIRSISTKTMVIVGKHDPATTVSMAEYIHNQIGSSELHIISDAAHFVNMEKADVFNNILIRFLKESV